MRVLGGIFMDFCLLIGVILLLVAAFEGCYGIN